MKADNETLKLLLEMYDELVDMTKVVHDDDYKANQEFYNKILEQTHTTIIRVLGKIE